MNLQETKRFVIFAELNIKIPLLITNYETNKNTFLDAIDYSSKRDACIMRQTIWR